MDTRLWFTHGRRGSSIDCWCKLVARRSFCTPRRPLVCFATDRLENPSAAPRADNSKYGPLVHSFRYPKNSEITVNVFPFVSTRHTILHDLLLFFFFQSFVKFYKQGIGTIEIPTNGPIHRMILLFCFFFFFTHWFPSTCTPAQHIFIPSPSCRRECECKIVFSNDCKRSCDSLKWLSVTDTASIIVISFDERFVKTSLVALTFIFLVVRS